MSLTQDGIREILRKEHMKYASLCVHASYRSFGTLDGGPSTLVQALLAEGNTVMVPTFTGSMRIPPPEGEPWPSRNGMDYSVPEYDRHRKVFDPDRDDLDIQSMGVIPAEVLRISGRVRGAHPTNSFSAIGPAAQSLVGSQTADAIWAPLDALVRANGTVVLMGVGYDRMTLLHLAESRVGRQPFIRWVNDGRGGSKAVSAGTCSSGFKQLAPILEPHVRRVQVGSSLWTLCPAVPVVEAVAKAIAANPELTHCDNPACRRCGDLLLGGPIFDAGNT